MKLLLTSSGIANKAIHEALVGLLGKPIAEALHLLIAASVMLPACDPGWCVVT